MYINEYGDPNDPKLILLAPMMVSGSDIYKLMSPHLKGEYFIIAPDQGGHGKAGAYTGADDEYRQLKEYLQKNGYTDIKLVYGASLGVAIGWRLFMDDAFNVEHAWSVQSRYPQKSCRRASQKGQVNRAVHHFM